MTKWEIHGKRKLAHGREIASCKEWENNMKRQERFSLVTGIILAILGGIYGIWIGFEARSWLLDTLVGVLLGATIGYFLGILLAGILTAPKENDHEP